jgi:hypothetical protein
VSIYAYSRSVNWLERNTGYNFFPRLPSHIQEIIEEMTASELLCPYQEFNPGLDDGPYREIDLNGRLAAVVWTEGVGATAGAEFDAEFVCAAEKPALRVQSQLVQAVGHVLDGLQFDELAAVDQFGVAGDVQILDKDLHVLLAVQGIGRKVVIVLDEGSAVDENTVHNLPEGLGQHIHREMLFHVSNLCIIF